ncbi:MAG: hypothetical protein ACQEWV_18015 [Bacillota bacterium]
MHNLFLPREIDLIAQFDPNLLGGVTDITGEAERIDESTGNGSLYQPTTNNTKKIVMTAIPYFACQ